LASALLFVLILVAFVWPTLYRYDRIKSVDEEAPVRINRFTGTAEVLAHDGWRVIRKPDFVPRDALDSIWAKYAPKQ